MRTIILVALSLCAGILSAQAETWRMRLGGCGEWQARIEVEQDQSGAWVGRMEQVQRGGPCARPTGEVIRAEFRAAIAGEHFFAVRTGNPDRAADTDEINCSFYGQIDGDRVVGSEMCTHYVGATRFALRFPPSDDLALRRPGSDREVDWSREYDREPQGDRGAFGPVQRSQRRP